MVERKNLSSKGIDLKRQRIEGTFEDGVLFGGSLAGYSGEDINLACQGGEDFRRLPEINNEKLEGEATAN